MNTFYHTANVYSIQTRIHEWAELVFGSATHARPLLDRVKQELDELEETLLFNDVNPTIAHHQLNAGTMKSIRNELADVAITLFRLAGSYGIDLLEEVDRKQGINEERKWKRHGDGTGQHIKNTEV